MGEINWEEMVAGKFVRLEEGKPKTLVLKNWRPQTAFKDQKTGEVKAGVIFDVLGEDNLEFDETTKKSYIVTAKGALKQYMPICKKAEAEGKDSIKVNVVSVGQGRETKYSITPVA